MNIKKARKRMILLTLLFFGVFLCMALFYYSEIRKHTYIGIRAQMSGESWIIKRIQYDGSASESGLAVGDKVLTINGVAVEDNELLNRWLIIEQAEKISILRDGRIQEITFKESSSSREKYIVFCIIDLLGFCFLFYYTKKQNGGYSGMVFYFFIILVIFSVISIVPSSMGVFLGRLIIILFVSLFPFFLDLCLKIYKTSAIYGKSKFYIGELGISFINIVLCILTLFIRVPYILLEYLAQGIFGVLGILLILVFIQNRRSWKENENRNASHINISLICVLSVIPLFLFYVFPIQWEVPFFLIIPFMLLPIISIFHLLIISKLIAHRYKIKKNSLYIILSGILSLIIIVLIFLSAYIPVYILGIYSFCLLCSLMPLVEEFLVATKRKSEQINSLQLFSAVEEERENISIFIHDTVIQDVIYHMKMIETMEGKINKKDILQILDEVVFFLRELCSDIYPLMIQEMGLKNALLALIGQMEKKYPVIIQYNIEIDEFNFLLKKCNFILRSIKELINNSILHGNATKILLSITKDADYCYFSVSDNGKFVKQNSRKISHFGLDVIKEKLVLLNGELFVNVNQETIITIKVPFDMEGENRE